MNFDERYKNVKAIWLGGGLEKFRKLFGIVPKSIVAKDLGMHNQTINARIDNPEDLSIRQLCLLAKLSGVPALDFCNMIIRQFETGED